MFQIAADMLSKPAALQVLLMLGLIIGVYILLVRPQLQRLARIMHQGRSLAA